MSVLEDNYRKTITTYKKLPPTRNSITIKTSHLFHILIIEFVENNYYLGSIQKTPNGSTAIQKTVKSSDRCLNISELFNETFIKRLLLYRIKFYNLPC